MKFEKLTDIKIRIILSLKDMETNHISVEDILANSADSQKLIESIITQAEKKLGFKAGDSQLLVEAIAPSSKECVFTITKLLEENCCAKKYINSFIFKFEKFDDFINLCIFLKNLSYLNLKSFSKNFSLIFYNNTYYLRLTEPGTSCMIIDYIKSLFEEFGKDVSCSIGIDGFLNEYGKVVFEKNAILKCINSFTHKKI